MRLNPFPAAAFLLRRTPLKRFARGIPVVELLALAQVGLLARQHLLKLNSDERRRLLSLVGQARGRPSSLGPEDREEFSALVGKLEPRLLFGNALNRVSPFPLPKRLLYGRRKSPARLTLKAGKNPDATP